MKSDSPLTYSLTEQALRQWIEDLEIEVEALHLAIKQLKGTGTMLEMGLERVEQRVEELEHRAERSGIRGYLSRRIPRKNCGRWCSVPDKRGKHLLSERRYSSCARKRSDE